MKKLILASVLPLTLAACSGDDPAETSSKPDAKPETAAPSAPATPTAPQMDTKAIMAAKTEEAKGAMMALGGSLKKELQTVMTAAGPIEAIHICNTRANSITAKVMMETNMDLGRVSLRNRNTDNAAEGWKKAVLEDFETRKAAGEAPDKLVYREIVDADGGKEFRMMKAIPTAPLCLTCHGASIDPEVAAKIDEFYPEDKAKGFSEGDIRGAFWVTSKL